MSRLLLPFADQQIEIPSLMPGNIALTVGLKQVMKNTNTVKELVSLVCFLLLWYHISDVLDYGDVCKLALFEVHLDVLPPKIKYHGLQISVIDLETAVLIGKDG